VRWIFAVVLVVHGLIHALGFLKAFGFADLPQLGGVSRSVGLIWLLAAALFLAAAAALFLWPRTWWALGALALALSLMAILPSWKDAKAGVIADAIVLAGVAFVVLSTGPASLRAAYERDAAELLSRATVPRLLGEQDITRLPPLVQRYLRTTGAIGRPLVRNVQVHMHGRIRSGPDARWMPLVAEQLNVVDPSSRLFYFEGSMSALPVQGFHRYVGSSATMRVKAAALVPVVEASGDEMARSETVTLFNDMCVLAPATLVDPRIDWTTLDGGTVRATFTNAGHTIQADLSFNDAGELVDFHSDDRSRASDDGRSFARTHWSTPLGAYRSFAGGRLASGGEARWRDADSEFAYIELAFDDVRYNVPPRR
jgi:hypothetical protein